MPATSHGSRRDHSTGSAAVAATQPNWATRRRGVTGWPAYPAQRQNSGSRHRRNTADCGATCVIISRAGTFASAAPSALPGPSPPQGMSDSASSPIAAAGAPSPPARRTAPMAKMEPTPNPVTDSANGPSKKLPVNICSPGAPATAPAGRSTAAWNSGPPATIAIGGAASHNARPVSRCRKPRTSPGAANQIAGNAQSRAIRHARAVFTRPDASNATIISNGRA